MKPWSVIGGIVDWSLKYRLLVLAVAAVVLFLGIGQLRKMAVDVYPESVLLSSRSRAKRSGCRQEVAEMVVPLEADLLSNVPFVDILSSKSVPGLSSIEMVFEPGTELLEGASGRPGAPCRSHGGAARSRETASMLQPRSATTRAMMIGLSSKDLSLIDMSVLARWNIRPRLMGIRGWPMLRSGVSGSAASGSGRS